jgi:hypothetical protein
MPLGGFPDADKGYSVRSLTGKPFPVKLPEGFPCKGERGKRDVVTPQATSLWPL